MNAKTVVYTGVGSLLAMGLLVSPVGMDLFNATSGDAKKATAEMVAMYPMGGGPVETEEGSDQDETDEPAPAPTTPAPPAMDLSPFGGGLEVTAPGATVKIGSGTPQLKVSANAPLQPKADVKVQTSKGTTSVGEICFSGLDLAGKTFKVCANDTATLETLVRQKMMASMSSLPQSGTSGTVAKSCSTVTVNGQVVSKTC